MKKKFLLIGILTTAIIFSIGAHSHSWSDGSWSDSTSYRRVSGTAGNYPYAVGYNAPRCGFSISWTTYGLGHSTGYALYQSTGYKGYDSGFESNPWSTSAIPNNTGNNLNGIIYNGLINRIRPTNGNTFSRQAL